jgi:hypothetical protein
VLWRAVALRSWVAAAVRARRKEEVWGEVGAWGPFIGRGGGEKGAQ